MRCVVGAWRVGRGLLQVGAGLLMCACIFPFLKPPQRMHHTGRWCARMLGILGVTLHTSGTPRAGATLLVANHVSWLDILAINATAPARFVSKADVRTWPLLGWLVACGGTLFIERERKRDAMRVVHQVAQALREGDTVAVFPEGTTSDGHVLLPFHANLLEAAIATETPAQPVAVRYSDASQPVSAAAAYVGELGLAQSLWRVVTARELRVHIHWLTAQGSRHADRRALAAWLREQIAEALKIA